MLGLLVLGAGYAVAEETKPDAKKSPAVTAEKKEAISTGEQKVIAKLALQYKVPEQDIVNLRTQGMGYGEISHALVIANKTGETLATIVALKTGGMGWGEIAKKYNLNLGQITKEAKKAENLAGKYGSTNKEPKPEKIGKPEKIHKMEKMEKPERPAKPVK